MTSITPIAEAFFEACETGKGWDACRAYCTPDATFSAQAEPLLDIKTTKVDADNPYLVFPVPPNVKAARPSSGSSR